jgi:hypothetical protein
VPQATQKALRDATHRALKRAGADDHAADREETERATAARSAAQDAERFKRELDDMRNQISDVMARRPKERAAGKVHIDRNGQITISPSQQARAPRPQRRALAPRPVHTPTPPRAPNAGVRVNRHGSIMISPQR